MTTILECYCEDDLLHIKYLEEYMENRSQVSGNYGKYMHLFLLIFPLYCDYIFLWIFTFKVTQVFVFAQMFCISYLFIMMTFKIFTSAIEDIRSNKKIWKKEITFFLFNCRHNKLVIVICQQSCKKHVFLHKSMNGDNNRCY